MNEVPVVACDEEWSEDGALGTLLLRFTETTADDCDGGGNCDFLVGAETAHLQPARFTVEKTDRWYELLYVSAYVTDLCGPGCTKLMFYSAEGELLASAENNTTDAEEEIFLPLDSIAEDHPYGTIALSSCNADVEYVWVSEFFDYVVSPSISQIKANY